MPAHKVDYIIVGQGLAGSILAHQLISRNKSVLVIDNDHQQSSSQVAAGIINPITGPRLSLTENFHCYFQHAKKYYAAISSELRTSVWQDLAQLRLIQDETQLDYCLKRTADSDYQDILGTLLDSDLFESKVGAIEIQQSAVIDSKTLIKTIRLWLIQQQSYRAIKVDYNHIEVNDKGFLIGDTHAAQLIFCEGFQAIHNPWLSSLPFKLTKGEILTIETDQPTSHLLNWGNWLAPVGGIAKLGSNYQWDDLTLNPSEQIKLQLLESLANNTHINGQVIDHEVGIRPTTRQRRPFIGPLSNLKRAYCFNGFGSKGCLLIPYYADLLCNHLTANTPINEDLARWL